MEKNKINSGVNRRNILRTLGATGATAVGATGVSGAASSENVDAVGIPEVLLESKDDEMVRAYRTYADDGKRRERAFNRHRDAVATSLESIGVSVPSSLEAADSVDVVPERKDGQASAHLVARFKRDREVIVHIFPQAERAYAHVIGDEDSQLVDPQKGIETMGCSYTYTCDCPSGCGWYMGYEKQYSVCQLPDGTVSREYVNGHCGCDDASNPCQEQ